MKLRHQMDFYLGWEAKKGLDEIYAIDIDRFKNAGRTKSTNSRNKPLFGG